jgi:hypothetical protein
MLVTADGCAGATTAAARVSDIWEEPRLKLRLLSNHWRMTNGTLGENEPIELDMQTSFATKDAEALLKPWSC